MIAQAIDALFKKTAARREDNSLQNEEPRAEINRNVAKKVIVETRRQVSVLTRSTERFYRLNAEKAYDSWAQVIDV